MVQSNVQYNPTPIDLGRDPKEGPKSLRQDFDFSAGIQSYDVDMTAIKLVGKMSLVQSVFIDNVTGANNQPVVLTVADTNQKISVPANFQGIFPIFATQNSKFNVSTTGNGKVSVYFANISEAPFMWQGVAIPLNVGGTLTVTDPILDATVSNNRVNVTSFVAAATLIDHSGTIAAGGTSQQAAAANAARQGFLLQNLDAAENLYVRQGAAAQIDTPGTFLVPPYASYQGVGTATINVNAATLGHKYTLVEW